MNPLSFFILAVFIVKVSRRFFFVVAVFVLFCFVFMQVNLGKLYVAENKGLHIYRSNEEVHVPKED